MANQSTGIRPLSRYAQKQRALDEGTRDPFDFQERPCAAPGTPTDHVVPNMQRFAPPKPKTAPISAIASANTVKATVIATKFMRGFLFLETEDGTKLYMGLNVVRRDLKGNDLYIGCVMECEIEPSPNGQGMRVKRALSLRPPEK